MSMKHVVNAMNRILIIASVSCCTMYGAPDKHYIEKLYTHHDGFDIPRQESDGIMNIGSSPTYGEITFDGAQKLLEYLKLQADDVMYDLGSGVGKLVVQVYLTTPVKKAVGIEFSPTRNNHAKAVRAQLKKDKKLKPNRALEFKEEDMASTDLSDATFIYLPSTCFSADFMKKITDNAEKARSKKLRIATLKHLPEDSNFELEDELKVKMTWSDNVPVYIYKRKNNEKTA